MVGILRVPLSCSVSTDRGNGSANGTRQRAVIDFEYSKYKVSNGLISPRGLEFRSDSSLNVVGGISIRAVLVFSLLPQTAGQSAIVVLNKAHTTTVALSNSLAWGWAIRKPCRGSCLLTLSVEMDRWGGPVVMLWPCRAEEVRNTVE